MFHITTKKLTKKTIIQSNINQYAKLEKRYKVNSNINNLAVSIICDKCKKTFFTFKLTSILVCPYCGNIIKKEGV